MTRADIDRLVEDRSLAREEFDDEQVAGYWAKAVASVADARVPGISSDGAFQRAYTAALQATLAVLAAHGLRVKSTANHYKAFYALQKLEDKLRPHALLFDELRVIRHASIYEPDEDETSMAARLAEALPVIDNGLSGIRVAILAVRPHLEASLPAA